MTRERLHSALHLLGEARRLLGASVLHVQAFDVGPDEIATMVLDGGNVHDQGAQLQVQLQRPDVEVDVWSSADRWTITEAGRVQIRARDQVEEG